MNFLRKNMFWTYTILSVIFGILALVFGALANYADRKENFSSAPTPPHTNTYNINGDYVNRDKKTNQETNDKPETVELKEKPTNEKTTKKSIINNGIINSGTNNGTQTVNNIYNEKLPRKINNEDVNIIRDKIPLDYKISFIYVNSTEESINFANEVFSVIKEMGYEILEVSAAGIYSDGKPYRKDERISFTLYDNDKKALIVIKEQK